MTSCWLAIVISYLVVWITIHFMIKSIQEIKKDIDYHSNQISRLFNKIKSEEMEN